MSPDLTPQKKHVTAHELAQATALFEGPIFAAHAVHRAELTMLDAVQSTEIFTATVQIGTEELTLPVVLFSHPYIKHVVEELVTPGEGLECRVGGTVFDFICIKPGTSVMAPPVPGTRSDEKLDRSQHMLQPIFVEYLRIMAEVVGGIGFTLHDPSPSGFYEPIRCKDDELHVFIYTLPSGIPQMTHPDTLFGLSVEAKGLVWPQLKSAPRRGVALTDGDHDVVQVIGNNIYILHNPYLMWELGDATLLKLFSKAVVLGLQFWLDGNEAVAIEIPFSSQTLQTECAAFLKLQVTAHEARIAKTVTTIAKLQEDLLAQRRNLVVQHKTHKVLFGDVHYQQTLMDNLVADTEAILLHPLVARAIIIPNYGFEVKTKLITILDGGVTYKIGTFGICLGIDPHITIWCEEAFHPKGVPHPHISPWAGHCFGNVGDPITEAVAEYRYADAIEYILRWLTEGYTPELILYNKIEEWPTVQMEQTAEAVVC